MARSPKHTTRDQVEITRVFYGRVIMPDGGAEHAGLFRTILVGPDNHKIIGPLPAIILNDLAAMCNGVRAVEHMDVVIKFFMDGRPISQTLGNRVLRVGEMNGDGFLRPMSARLQTKILEPKAMWC